MVKLDKRWAARTVGSGRSMRDRKKSLDGYGSPREAFDALVEDGRERFPLRIWEPAAGLHHMVRAIKRHGHRVFTSDVYAWSTKTKKIVDFLLTKRPPKKYRCIVTNPPFYLAQAFAEHAMRILPEGGRLYLLLRVQWLEGVKRKGLFDATPPKYVYVFSYRLPMMHAFEHKGKRMKGGMMAMSWFVLRRASRVNPAFGGCNVEAVKIVVKRRVADVRIFQNDVLVAVLGRDRRGVHRLHHTKESSPSLIERVEKFVKVNTNELGLFTAHGEYELE